jgi:hypothetical protein
MSTALRDAIERCVDHGVTERPPVPGQRYVAFVVHPRKPAPIVFVTLVVAHREGDMRVVDLARDGLTVEQAAELVKAYGIDQVTGADDEGDSSFSLAHAVAGAIYLLREGAHD